MGEQQLELLARAADGLKIPTTLNPEKDGVVLPDEWQFYVAYAEAVRQLVAAEKEGGESASQATKEFTDANFDIVPIQGAILVKYDPTPAPRDEWEDAKPAATVDNSAAAFLQK